MRIKPCPHTEQPYTVLNSPVYLLVHNAAVLKTRNSVEPGSDAAVRCMLQQKAVVCSFSAASKHIGMRDVTVPKATPTALCCGPDSERRWMRGKGPCAVEPGVVVVSKVLDRLQYIEQPIPLGWLLEDG